jgi:hypothetical protein
MKAEKSYKQLVFVLNKCDLVPNWATVSFASWHPPRPISLAFVPFRGPLGRLDLKPI